MAPLNFIDMTGRRFGRYLVLSRHGSTHGGKATWLCRCDCGVEKVVCGKDLRQGRVVSCGCYRLGLLTARRLGGKIKHGRAGTPTYRSWAAMVGRCMRSTSHKRSYYGGRGIRVCERWLDFQNFLADMGERPPGCSIDRIDSDGHYCPENCRWLSYSGQARNKRSNRFLTYGGSTKCVTDWARDLGMNPATLGERLRHGWSVERALTTPLQRRY